MHMKVVLPRYVQRTDASIIVLSDDSGSNWGEACTECFYTSHPGCPEPVCHARGSNTTSFVYKHRTRAAVQICLCCVSTCTPTKELAYNTVTLVWTNTTNLIHTKAVPQYTQHHRLSTFAALQRAVSVAHEKQVHAHPHVQQAQHAVSAGHANPRKHRTRTQLLTTVCVFTVHHERQLQGHCAVTSTASHCPAP